MMVIAFVDQLFIAHLGAVFRSQDQVEQRCLARLARAPIGDITSQQVADARTEALDLAVAARRQPVRRQGIERHPPISQMEEPREDSRQFVGVLELGVEHGPDNDMHGDAGHRRFQVDDSAGAPAGQFALGALLHNLRVALDVAQVEGGLQRLPAALPGFTVAGEDVLAQDVAQRAFDHRRLAEGFAARRQNFADVIGMVDEVAAHGSEAYPHQVALPRRAFR